MRNQNYQRVSPRLIACSATLMVFGALSFSAWSQGSRQLIPARFSNNQGAISTMLEMPPGVITGDNVVGIPCQAIVEPTGQVRDVNCFTDLFANRPYVREILDAAREGTISPALVNRLPVRVLMNFSILFICKESNCTVAAVPHHNVHSKKFGLNYFSPQPILSDDNWYTGFDEKMAIIRARGGQMPVATGPTAGMAAAEGGRGMSMGRGMGMAGVQQLPPGAAAYIIVVEVDKNGKATDADVDKNMSGMLDEAKLASEEITSVSFIPGYVEGEPAAMEYQEYGMVNLAMPQNLGPLDPPR